MRFKAIWNLFSSGVTIAIIAFFLMGMLSSVTPIDVDMIKRVCGDSDKNCVTSDAYWIAVQIGRLDIISICLAILGVTVGLSAVFGFLYVKEKSELVAAQSAAATIELLKAEISQNLENHATKFLEEQVPKFAEQYFLLAQNAVDISDYADQIAGEAGNEEDKQ
ncbi:MAG TPA: hypothetical protein DF774_02410 [Rheinheimera sp.]|uniref:hypothetical protein n=1 Tax=Rheinheimera sp. TaxID=1869214 RepID=UPI000ECAAB6A|nr:hypothetical protein [Rheinheimera sp.]HCU64593.1 hypothetical protein [Rheinheimera sp.]